MKKTVLTIILTMLLLIVAPATAGYLRADINGDGRVDIEDLAIMMKEWLMSEPAFTVTGYEFNPDITGVLTEAGVYNDLPYYTTAQGGLEVWYSAEDERYLISSGRGVILGGLYSPETANGTTVEGDYLAVLPFIGTATVSGYVIPDETTKPMRTRRSRMVIR